MPTQHVRLGNAAGISRRDVLKAGFAAGATLSALPLYHPTTLWSAEAGPPKRGGILRVRGYDPAHFDHHLTINFKTNTTLSFVHSRLVRHKLGPGVQPGTFIVEPDLAERFALTIEPHSTLYGLYTPDQPRNSSHVNDPKITAMLKEEMRTKDLEAR